ncbi:hypothetical protein ACJIZ3_006362 [Penstemon smallii]|uniref:Uncharacterized protein n=1 Tax=Penstemon smallii TaxID=265156 RepID=A0ABD3S7K5_9LAMI
MAFARSTFTFVLLQLSLLLCTSTIVNGDNEYPVAPPAEAPHPSHHHHAPTPTPTPTYPPTSPPRKFVAVQGMVYCKSCKYRGVDTLLAATPLPGALVKLQCNNTKYPLVEQTKTDKNGYFFFMPQKLTTSGSHKCKVFLVSSPIVTCGVPTNLHAGAAGAILFPTVIQTESKFALFTVGPFAFEPHKNLPCTN